MPSHLTKEFYVFGFDLFWVWHWQSGNRSYTYLPQNSFRNSKFNMNKVQTSERLRRWRCYNGAPTTSKKTKDRFPFPFMVFCQRKVCFRNVFTAFPSPFKGSLRYIWYICIWYITFNILLWCGFPDKRMLCLKKGTLFSPSPCSLAKERTDVVHPYSWNTWFIWAKKIETKQKENAEIFLANTIIVLITHIDRRSDSYNFDSEAYKKYSKK